MNKAKVAVLLSTYNGARYLREQIDSILNQKDVNVLLYIRDDRSTDDTPKILKEYEHHENLSARYAENVGAPASFMDLVRTVPLEADYYAFADQDDIWQSEKLIRATDAIRACRKEAEPVLYASNQTVADQNGMPLRIRFPKNPPIDLLNIIDKNYIAGCTFVFNRALMVALRSCEQPTELIESRMHDTWVAVVAAATGTVLYDENSYILYRQHDNNVVGVRTESCFKRVLKRIRTKTNFYHADMAEVLLRLYSGSLTEQNREVLNLYSHTRTFSGKIGFLKSGLFRKTYYRNKLSFGIKLLLFERGDKT